MIQLIIVCLFILWQTPGPGAYGSMDPDIYKTKKPSYSMIARNGMPGDTTKKPGPGAHSPERVCLLDLIMSLVNTDMNRHKDISNPAFLKAYRHRHI